MGQARLPGRARAVKGQGGAVGRRAVATGAAVGAILLTATLGAAQDLSRVVEVRLYLDNDTATVMLMTLPPGSASGEHTAPEHELGIVLEGELTLVTPKGREGLGPGTVHWLPSLTPHDARNEGDRPVKLWVILFKKPPQ